MTFKTLLPLIESGELVIKINDKDILIWCSRFSGVASRFLSLVQPTDAGLARSLSGGYYISMLTSDVDTRSYDFLSSHKRNN